MIPSSLSLSDETVPVRRACKIHEYFSSFRFTFLSAPPYILGDCKTSLVLSPLLSLSLSHIPHALHRFVRNRDKSVLFDRRAKSPPPTFIIIRIPSFEGRQMRRLEGIKLAIVA